MSQSEPSKKWIKYPRPGEFRGEGHWFEVDNIHFNMEDYNFCKETGYMPTFEGNNPNEATEKGNGQAQ